MQILEDGQNLLVYRFNIVYLKELQNENCCLWLAHWMSPLGGGVLTGKYNKNNKEQERKQRQNTSGNSRLEVQNDLAKSFLHDRNMLIARG